MKAMATFGRSLLDAAEAVVGSLVFLFVLALAEEGLFESRASYAPAVALASVLAVGVVALLARRGRRPSPVRAASLALLAWAPYLFAAALYHLSEPLVVGRWRCGTGLMGLVFLAVGSVPFVFALAALVAAAAERYRLDLATRVVAAATGAIALVVLFAAVRRDHKIDPDAYVASLPVVGEVRGPDDRLAFGPLAVEQRGSAKPGDDATGCVLFAPAGTRTAQVTEECTGLRVRQDERNNLWILEWPVGGATARYALDLAGAGLERAEIVPQRVAASLRPPAPWTGALACGCAVALALAALALRDEARARAWRSARRGAHSGGGWVTFDDAAGPPMHLAAAAAMPVGPVLVGAPGSGTPSYREHGGAVDGDARLIAGSFEGLLSAAQARGTAYYAFATLTLALTLEPMIAAACVGLLG